MSSFCFLLCDRLNGWGIVFTPALVAERFNPASYPEAFAETFCMLSMSLRFFFVTPLLPLSLNVSGCVTYCLMTLDFEMETVPWILVK